MRDGWSDLQRRPWSNLLTQLCAQGEELEKKRREPRMGLDQGDTLRLGILTKGARREKNGSRCPSL